MYIRTRRNGCKPFSKDSAEGKPHVWLTLCQIFLVSFQRKKLSVLIPLQKDDRRDGSCQFR